MHEGSITIRIAAKVHEIERLHRLIRQFGELHEIPSRALYSVNLALDEVVSNVVLYGYDGTSEDVITVHIETAGANLLASVEDSGREFDPLSQPLPDLEGPLDARKIGGLGIHLMRSLMDGRCGTSARKERIVSTCAKRIR